jgi:hypothetical protein
MISYPSIPTLVRYLRRTMWYVKKKPVVQCLKMYSQQPRYGLKCLSTRNRGQHGGYLIVDYLWERCRGCAPQRAQGPI